MPENSSEGPPEGSEGREDAPESSSPEPDLSQRYPPDDPREWMNRARSALQLARAEGPAVYLEDLCYQAQQAAEKAIKALLIDADVSFPYVHDLARLLTVLEEEGATDVPERVKEAERLTRFAVFTRYPGVASPVDREEYEEALRLAEGLLEWAEERIRSESAS